MARPTDSAAPPAAPNARVQAPRGPLGAWLHPRHDPSLEHAEQGRLLGAMTAGQAVSLAAMVTGAENAAAAERSAPAATGKTETVEAQTSPVGIGANVLPEMVSARAASGEYAPSGGGGGGEARVNDDANHETVRVSLSNALPGDLAANASLGDNAPALSFTDALPASSAGIMMMSMAEGAATQGAAASATAAPANEPVPSPASGGSIAPAKSSPAIGVSASGDIGSDGESTAPPSSTSSPSIDHDSVGGSSSGGTVGNTAPGTDGGNALPSAAVIPSTDHGGGTGSSGGTGGNTVSGGGSGNGGGGGVGNGGGTLIVAPAPPVISVQAVSGTEDHTIALAIALAPLGAGENAIVHLGGLPLGATLSAGTQNLDGSWSLSPAQLPGLTCTPPQNWSGSVAVQVDVQVENSAGQAHAHTSFAFAADGVADAATLQVAAAAGREDTAIPLTITALLVDTDGSEHLSIRIDHIPAGAQLSAGTDLGQGHWLLAPGDLAGLTLTPPQNFHGTLSFNVTAIATESNGDMAQTSLPCSIVISPVADAPALSALPALGLEDHPIALHIGAALGLGATESLSLTIEGLPPGATLSAGHVDAGGVWHLAAGELAGLTCLPAHNSDADFTLTITATAQETDGSSATVSAFLPVSVTGVADVPSVSTAASVGLIDTAISLTLSGALADTDGSETLSFVVRGMPAGFALNHGSDNGDHSWTLTPAELSGLTLTTPYGYEGNLHLTLTAVSHEADGGLAASAALPFQVAVGDVVHGITIDLGLGIDPGHGVALGAGVQTNLLDPVGLVVPEDAQIALPDASLLLGLHAGVTQFLFSGLPSGVSLSAGTDLGNGVWGLSPGQLSHLNLITPPNSDQDFTLTIRGELLGDLVTLDLHTTPVHVIGVADAPILRVDAMVGTEGLPTALSIHGALTDTDGSECLSYHIHDLPVGFTLNAGIQNEDGGWSLSPAQLAGLAVSAPERRRHFYHLRHLHRTRGKLDDDGCPGASAYRRGKRSSGIDAARLARHPRPAHHARSRSGCGKRHGTCHGTHAFESA